MSASAKSPRVKKEEDEEMEDAEDQNRMADSKIKQEEQIDPSEANQPQQDKKHHLLETDDFE